MKKTESKDKVRGEEDEERERGEEDNDEREREDVGRGTVSNELIIT